FGSSIVSAATRVALMNGEGSEQIANVVDLAHVALSREPELELLDRALIRRVLEEQKLSLSGVVDASQAIAVGKLLTVDLIAVVVVVRTAHRKREGRTPAFHTVGVMTVRNADLPRSQDGLCEAVGLLVERGLARSPDLAVLERRRLAHVNEERALPVVEPPKD